MTKLTDVKINSAKPQTEPFRLSDGGALFLEVRPSGAKLWRYRYRLGDKQGIYAIGKYYSGRKKPADHVGLDSARTERDKARKLVRQGIHPTHKRQADKLIQIADNSNTFQGVAKEWIAINKAHWTPTYALQVERTLKADVLPHIGPVPIRSVEAAHLLKILQRIEKRGAKTVALGVRQWCSSIIRYGVRTQRADHDPAAALYGVIKRDKVKHRTPLTRDQIPELLKKIEKNTYRTTGIALNLLLLTFVRPGELRKSEWLEFDLERSEWRIPPERMKMRDMHIVPLSNQVVELLEELKSITGGSRYLFPNHRRPETVMTITTLNRALERMGYAGKFSAHGFRATASTLLNELKYRPDVIERQLAHAERNGSRAAYNRAEYLAERREMMQDWANWIDTLTDNGNVIPIRSNRST
jgi:integrase